jgi:DNA-binding ferritin-like protein (Dps family)
MKTALDLSIDKIKELQSNVEIGDFTKRAYAICMDVLEDYKQIEKEQHKETFKQSRKTKIFEIGMHPVWESWEQYYNETFNI